MGLKSDVMDEVSLLPSRHHGSSCAALHISDQHPCAEIAISPEGPFCSFHFLQFLMLCKGYEALGELDERWFECETCGLPAA